LWGKLIKTRFTQTSLNVVAPIASSSQLELLKYLAIVAMLLDHTNKIMHFDLDWMSLVGRSAYPLFAFVLVYNYIHNTKDALNYLSRLLILGILSQAPYAMAFPAGIGNSANIMFSLAAGLFGLIYLEYIINHAGRYDIRFRWMHSYLFMLYFIFAGFIISYMYFGLFMIFAFYFLMRFPSHQSFYWLAFFILMLNLPSGAVIMSTSLLSLIIIALVLQVDVKIKRMNKMVFYIFYPIHLIVLLSLSYFLA